MNQEKQREAYEKMLKKCPDILTPMKANRWLRQGHLQHVQTQTTKIIPKLWLIDFYCSYGYTIVKMSDKHIKLMKKLFKQNQ